VLFRSTGSESYEIDLNQIFGVKFPDGAVHEINGYEPTEKVKGEISDLYYVRTMEENKDGVRLRIIAPFSLRSTEDQLGAHSVVAYPVPKGYEVVRADDMTFIYDYDSNYIILEEAMDTWDKKVYIRKIGGAPAAEASAPKFSEMAGVNFYVNGEKHDLTLPVLNISGRAMYPFRECLEYIGAEISWDPDARVAKGALDGKVVEFPIDSNTYRVNGQTFSMDQGVTAFIHNGRTYIPLRYAAEALGYSVQWEASTNTIQLVS
jgi:hypothetical protein